MPTPAVYDHLRPSETDVPDGIYRVVGVTEETVTLLQVGDADGRRVHTGELIGVTPDDLDGFTSAKNPDGNRPLGDLVRSNVEMVYWSIRVFLVQLTTHPVPAAVAILVLLAGTLGEGVFTLPDRIRGVLILVGSLGLAYVGSGRLSR